MFMFRILKSSVVVQTFETWEYFEIIDRLYCACIYISPSCLWFFSGVGSVYSFLCHVFYFLRSCVTTKTNLLLLQLKKFFLKFKAERVTVFIMAWTSKPLFSENDWIICASYNRHFSIYFWSPFFTKLPLWFHFSPSGLFLKTHISSLWITM